MMGGPRSADRHDRSRDPAAQGGFGHPGRAARARFCASTRVAITHEHWDHVSGFLQARDALAGLKIKALWFAWTEDPADELGKKLRADFAKDLQALQMAVSRAANPQGMQPIANLLGFFGEAPILGAAAGSASATNTTGAAFQAIRKLAGREPEYRR